MRAVTWPPSVPVEDWSTVIRRSPKSSADRTSNGHFCSHTKAATKRKPPYFLAQVISTSLPRLLR